MFPPFRVTIAPLPRPLLTIVAAVVMAGKLHGGGSPNPPPVYNSQSGKELAEQLCAAFPLESSDRHGVFVIGSGRNKTEIPMECQVILQEGMWETVYLTSNTPAAGAEKLVIIHATNGPNHYLYARAPKPGAPLPEAGPISPEALEEPFAGSDFSIGELGL